MNKSTSSVPQKQLGTSSQPHAMDALVQADPAGGGSRLQPSLGRLMERYVGGDEDAFRTLHHALTPSLRRQIASKLSDRAAVEDLLQITFLKAHLARDRFSAQTQDHPDRAVVIWYSTIARNATTDYLRKRGRSRITLLASDDEAWCDRVPDSTPSIEEARVIAEDRGRILRWLQEAIAQLPAAQRDVIELHRLREMSMQEVATLQGARVGTVRVRAHRAYSTLTGLAREANLRRGDSLLH